MTQNSNGAAKVFHAPKRAPHKRHSYRPLLHPRRYRQRPERGVVRTPRPEAEPKDNRHRAVGGYGDSLSAPTVPVAHHRDIVCPPKGELNVGPARPVGVAQQPSAGAEHPDSVDAVATIHIVRALATFENIVACASKERIVSVLAEQDVQLQTETFGLAVVPLPNVAPTPEAASVFVLLRLSGHKIHRGRDPPTQHRERAPPFAFS